MPQFTKILVAFDGSENGLKALDSAKQLAVGQDAHLTVAYTHEANYQYPIRTAVNPAGDRFMYHSEDAKLNEHPGDVVYEADVYDNVMSAAKVKLADLPDVVYEKLIGHPSTEIVHYAKAKDIDLIIVGNRGLGAVKKFFMGSVSQKVTNEAECSVLVVK